MIDMPIISTYLLKSANISNKRVKYSFDTYLLAGVK